MSMAHEAAIRPKDRTHEARVQGQVGKEKPRKKKDYDPWSMALEGCPALVRGP